MVSVVIIRGLVKKVSLSCGHTPFNRIMSAKTVMTQSIPWKFLNARDTWVCVSWLLEYYDIPLE